MEKKKQLWLQKMLHHFSGGPCWFQSLPPAQRKSLLQVMCSKTSFPRLTLTVTGANIHPGSPPNVCSLAPGFIQMLSVFNIEGNIFRLHFSMKAELSRVYHIYTRCLLCSSLQCWSCSFMQSPVSWQPFSIFQKCVLLVDLESTLLSLAVYL